VNESYNRNVAVCFIYVLFQFVNLCASDADRVYQGVTLSSFVLGMYACKYVLIYKNNLIVFFAVLLALS